MAEPIVQPEVCWDTSPQACADGEGQSESHDVLANDVGKEESRSLRPYPSHVNTTEAYVEDPIIAEVHAEEPSSPLSSAHRYKEEIEAAQPDRAELGSLVVPQYVVNGGFDIKFQIDPHEVDLKGLLGGEEYRYSVARINEAIEPARANAGDFAMLATGVAMVPLIPFGVRTWHRKKWRKRLLLASIDEFNMHHPELKMRWRPAPASELVIDRRQLTNPAPVVVMGIPVPAQAV